MFRVPSEILKVLPNIFTFAIYSVLNANVTSNDTRLDLQASDDFLV